MPRRLTAIAVLAALSTPATAGCPTDEVVELVRYRGTCDATFLAEGATVVAPPEHSSFRFGEVDLPDGVSVLRDADDAAAFAGEFIGFDHPWDFEEGVVYLGYTALIGSGVCDPQPFAMRLIETSAGYRVESQAVSDTALCELSCDTSASIIGVWRVPASVADDLTWCAQSTLTCDLDTGLL